MAKLTDYTGITRFDSNGILITDGSSGTRKIAAQDAAIDLAGMISPMQHRNIYGGRNLGSTVTDAQKAAISSGSFDNLFIGDYWTINGTRWVIADMDYFYQVGDTAFQKHHLVVVPNVPLFASPMNDANSTDGGYLGSKMYTESLNQAKTMFQAAFPNMVLTHRDALVNATTGGHASATLWVDSTVELMSEIQVYGSMIFSVANDGTTLPALYTTGKQQFALFRLNPVMINIRSWYWLRDVVSDKYFAVVAYYGAANCYGASYTYGVRPYAVIGVA